MPTNLVDRERQQRGLLLGRAHERDGTGHPGEHPARDRATLVEHERRADAALGERRRDGARA